MGILRPGILLLAPAVTGAILRLFSFLTLSLIVVRRVIATELDIADLSHVRNASLAYTSSHKEEYEMGSQISGNGASGHLDNGSAYEMVGYGRLNAQKRPMSKGIMAGWQLEIGLASVVLILPMFVLTALLLGLVFRHQMPYYSSTYSYNNEIEVPLGSVYFVNYSATTLVYIASLSSTLATLLISAAMILFSYSLARSMAQESDANNAPKLPTPFQCQLLIRMVDGRLMALGSYLLYVFGKKQRQVRVVPMLSKAVAMMLALVLLA